MCICVWFYGFMSYSMQTVSFINVCICRKEDKLTLDCSTIMFLHVENVNSFATKCLLNIPKYSSWCWSVRWKVYDLSPSGALEVFSSLYYWALSGFKEQNTRWDQYNQINISNSPTLQLKIKHKVILKENELLSLVELKARGKKKTFFFFQNEMEKVSRGKQMQSLKTESKWFSIWGTAFL